MPGKRCGLEYARQQTRRKRRSMIYSSPDDGKLYQQRPTYSKPSLYRPKGWTDTVVGYQREAKQWAMCLLRNRRLMKRPYTWAVHINLNEEFPPDQLGPMWTKVARKLEGRGIVALWVREANRLNKLHYHIVVKNIIGKTALKKAIEESMPSRTVVKWRKRVEPIKNEWRLCHYVVKAKVKGRNKIGVVVDDLYWAKRLLFKAKMPFRKVGIIGDFWEQGKSKSKLWNDIKTIEKKISDGLEKPNVKRLAAYVHDFIGGYFPLQQVERSISHDADEPVVQEWIERLLANEWAKTPNAETPLLTGI